MGLCIWLLAPGSSAEERLGLRCAGHSRIRPVLDGSATAPPQGTAEPSTGAPGASVETCVTKGNMVHNSEGWEGQSVRSSSPSSHRRRGGARSRGSLRAWGDPHWGSCVLMEEPQWSRWKAWGAKCGRRSCGGLTANPILVWAVNLILSPPCWGGWVRAWLSECLQPAEVSPPQREIGINLLWKRRVSSGLGRDKIRGSGWLFCAGFCVFWFGFLVGCF